MFTFEPPDVAQNVVGGDYMEIEHDWDPTPAGVWSLAIPPSHRRR